MTDNKHSTIENTPYARLGGETKLRALVDSFYHFMDNLEKTQPVRNMHPTDISISADKLFMFLSGWMGGPSLYIEKYGHPKLRARHLPFSIGTEERNQWLLCMKKAMEEQNVEEQLRKELMAALVNTADFMRNREEKGDVLPINRPIV